MKTSDVLYNVMAFLRDNEQFGDDWSEEISTLQSIVDNGYEPDSDDGEHEECVYVVDFYADAFFKIDESKSVEEYIDENWAYLVEQARDRLPEADYEVYQIH